MHPNRASRSLISAAAAVAAGVAVAAALTAPASAISNAPPAPTKAIFVQALAPDTCHVVAPSFNVDTVFSKAEIIGFAQQFNWAIPQGVTLTCNPANLLYTLDQHLALSETVTGGNLAFSTAPTNPVLAGTALDGTDHSVTGTLPVNISDARGNGAGWKVQVAATPFTIAGTSHTLPAAVLTPAATTTCATDVVCTTAANGVTDAVTLSPAATTIQSAATDAGLGNQSAAPTFRVAVPGNSYAGTYSSNWTVSLTTGP
jgi:hypothetical protein